MPSCDVCGAEGRLVKALIEGTELNVCQNCAKFGKILKAPVMFVKKGAVIKHEQKPEPLEIIVPDYSTLIRKKREEMGLTQEDFAKKIAEKESIMQKIEAGQMEPSINIAKKLERFLNIKLVEQYDEKGVALSAKGKTAEFTIGDAIKLKQRKRE